MIYKRLRDVMLALAVAAGAMQTAATAEASTVTALVPYWLNIPPIHFIYSMLHHETPVTHIPEPKQTSRDPNLRPFEKGLFSKGDPALTLSVDKKSVPVSDANLPAPVAVRNNSPLYFNDLMYQSAPNIPEPKNINGILGSSIKGFLGIQEPAPGYKFDKKSLPVNITNLPVPVVVSNDSLPVTIRNTSLGVQVLNVPLPVGIVNDTVFVSVTNVPLPTVVINDSFPVTLSNSSIPVNVLDLPLPVGLVNETVFANITNLPLPTVVVNDSFPVTLSNSSIPVNVLDLPLPVGIVNATLPVNVQNLPLPVGLVNASIPVTILNDTLKVNIQNTPFSVNVNNQPLAVNVQNAPLQVKFDQPINITSDQLAAYLASINATNTLIASILQNQTNGRVCPTDSNFGTEISAPCRRINSTCYCFFNNITLNSSDAAAFCKAAGFDGLVSMETRSEAMLVRYLLYLLVPTPASTSSPIRYYTSGSDAAVPGSFVWTTTNTPFDPNQLYWGNIPIQQPSNGADEECVIISYPVGQWNDYDCDSSLNFICELSSISNPIG